MIVKVAVAAECGNGPMIDFVKVECTQEDYENGDHYVAAKDWMMDQDGDSPFAIDEHDPGMQHIVQPNWDDVLLITTPYGG